MKKLTNLEKFGLIAAVVVIATYFYMGKIYDPQGKSLKKTVKQLNKIVGEINGIKDISPINTIKKQVKKKEETLEKLREKQGGAARITGDSAEITVLLERITRLIQENNLIAVEISPAKKGADNGELYAGLKTYDLTLTGGYFAMTGFIKNLKALPDIVIIRKLFVENGEVQGDLTITMTVMI